MFSRRTNWKLVQNAYSQGLAEARAEGKQLLDLTVSNPTRCGFRLDHGAVLAALAMPESLDYDPQPQGLRKAREAVAHYYDEVAVGNRTQISPEQIFLTTSTSEAYSFVFRLLCDPGDEVLVPRPSYPLFEFLADIQDVQLRFYELFYDHGWHLDVAGLRGAITERTRAVLVVNPNNPTGSFVHASEMKQLAAICREKSLALIADEVFLDYAVEAHAEVSAAFSTECLSFALSGLSKIACLPQMKLAWIVINGPEQLREQARERLEVIADTYLSVNAPIQHATARLLSLRDGIQNQLRQRVRENLGTLDAALSSTPSIQRLRVEGGWYAVLRVPATSSDEELAVDLIRRKGVLVHPGHFYDFPQMGFLVVSLITPKEEFGRGAEALLQ